MANLNEAKTIADRCVGMLREGCDRIEIGGSIRRESHWCNDIEIVCTPKKEKLEWGKKIGENQVGFIRNYKAFVSKIGARVEKGKPDGKYVKLYLAKHTINLDLFMVRHPAQWGPIFFIRTGPADWNKFMVDYCKSRNVSFQSGRLLKEETTKEHLERCEREEIKPSYRCQTFVMDTPEEEDVFKALGLPYVPPEQREQWLKFNKKDLKERT